MAIPIHRLPLIKILFSLAVVGIGAVGYLTAHRFMTQSSSSVASTHTTPAAQQQAAPAAPALGTTASIDSLTAEDASSEASINAKYEQSDQSAAQTTDRAAANVEGAYDESTY